MGPAKPTSTLIFEVEMHSRLIHVQGQVAIAAGYDKETQWSLSFFQSLEDLQAGGPVLEPNDALLEHLQGDVVASSGAARIVFVLVVPMGDVKKVKKQIRA